MDELKKELKDLGFDISKVNGWSLDWTVYHWIYKNLKPNLKILEVGAGLGTELLSKMWDVTSVENNQKFINLYSGVKYHHCPLVDKKYDKDRLREIIANTSYNLMIIDGPVGSENRVGILDHLDIFNPQAKYIVDDTHNPNSMRIAKTIADKFSKNLNLQKAEAYNKTHVFLT